MNEDDEMQEIINTDSIYITTNTKNYEEMGIDQLKDMRKTFDLKKVRPEHQDVAYLCRMVDLLLEKVERLENK